MNTLTKALSLFAKLPVGVELLRKSLSATAVQQSAAPRNPRLKLAVQLVEDPLYFALFSAISQGLARELKKNGASLETELVAVRAIAGAVGVGPMASIKRSFPISYMVVQQWVRAYEGIASGVGLRSKSIAHPVSNLLDAARSLRLWLELRGRGDISDLHVDGLHVGDLVIDSYLRFRPSPRLDTSDPFIVALLWQVHRDVRLGREYFAGPNRPNLYLTSYTTYIEHGVATRVALEAGVPVWSFGSLVQFGKKLSPRDYLHTPGSTHYRQSFAALDDKPECLARAEQQLGIRLSGGIDAATSYMKVSAYAKSAVEVPDVKDAVVVFLHDFYDSPHVYHDLVFPDFWSWICCTIETLRAANIPFFLKAHPNQISLSNEALTELKDTYPDLPFLPHGVTNSQLAQAGIRCGVTVYGTVAHELAYLGVPTIGCARHPHVSFDFCLTAKTVAEYKRMLETVEQLAPDAGSMREQALQFYYMHNLHGSDEAHDLRRKWISLWAANTNAQVSETELCACFEALRDAPGYARLIHTLTAEVTGASSSDNVPALERETV